MACNCKELDGNPSEYCLGTCKGSEEYLRLVAKMDELGSSLMIFFEHKLADVARRLNDEYRRGIRDGFELARGE